MRHIKKKYLEEIEVSELDIENVHVLLGECDDDDWDYDIIEEGVNKVSWAGEGDPMNIDDIIKELNNLKESGANYVEIMYHCDHHGYNFTGLEMRKATEEEIQKEKIKDDARKILEKKNKIQKMEKELAKLKK